MFIKKKDWEQIKQAIDELRNPNFYHRCNGRVRAKAYEIDSVYEAWKDINTGNRIVYCPMCGDALPRIKHERNY